MIDLANEVIKETYRHDSKIDYMLRVNIHRASRFIIDENMSEMMAHLSTTPYNKTSKKGELLISQRRSARLPFDSIFVQYDGRAFRRGLLAAIGDDTTDLWGKPLAPEDDVIDPVGWLIEQDPRNERLGGLIVATEFLMAEGRAMRMPFSWAYTTSEADLSLFNRGHDPLGTIHLDQQAGQLAHGVTGFNDKGCAIMYHGPKGKAGIRRDFLLDVRSPDDNELLYQTHYLVAEAGGALRYMYALLNMLDQVPVSYERERRTKAYLVNGHRRAAVDTKVIRLILPNRTITYREYARQLIQGVVTRVAHPVRGHWRTYGPHHCGEFEQHDWGPTDPTGHADCTRCETSRTWIKDYRTGAKERSDAVAKIYSVGAR